jgi:hypothetical protein
MRARRHSARLMRTVALALVLSLCAPPVLAQVPDDETSHQRSKISKYVIPVVFVASFVALGVVLVAALVARRDDNARLRAATAKLDEALAKGSGGTGAGTAPYNIRSSSGETRRGVGLATRLAGPGPLRTPTP